MCNYFYYFKTIHSPLLDSIQAPVLEHWGVWNYSFYAIISKYTLILSSWLIGWLVGFVLWHINRRGYLMLHPVYTYILNIYN